MQTIDIQEVPADLSELIEKAAKGEPFIIARAGKPMVQVSPVDLEAKIVSSGFGFLKGQLGTHNFDPDFVDHEIIAMFEGEDEG
ncbi:Antitoxin Phd_YefM, type II toxin-antitoxin system [Granulicella rosea]|uniref:Antitoxin Phd_YefM, type II toxin-antitoxin system n=1 Tax=Granulicella rosea TaxID=474952 RepID=A0A239M0N3_9BACT|nr:hypothetical protein [Granulicella rosea]SNT36070.1 Antitoxin Phd_YefM, type II toxin-antitoxin system [Granulicella rosea]